jgi:hypothetical protein
MNYFGERLYQLNEIMKVKEKAERNYQKFMICTLVGWLVALIMVIVVIFK